MFCLWVWIFSPAIAIKSDIAIRSETALRSEILQAIHISIETWYQFNTHTALGWQHKIKSWHGNDSHSTVLWGQPLFHDRHGIRIAALHDNDIIMTHPLLSYPKDQQPLSWQNWHQGGSASWHDSDNDSPPLNEPWRLTHLFHDMHRIRMTALYNGMT